MLGASSAQDVHIFCLDFRTVAATHQDIRPKLSIIQLLHALSYGELFALEGA